MKPREFNTRKETLAAAAYANCLMILENAICMPDEYIKENYGSDLKMCRCAEAYWALGNAILRNTPNSPCVGFNYRSAIAGEDEHGTIKDCLTCKHRHNEPGMQPCASCFNAYVNKWEPMEADGE